MQKELWVLVLFSGEQVFCFDSKTKAMAYAQFTMSIDLCPQRYERAVKSMQESSLIYENYIEIEYEPENPYACIKRVPLNPCSYMTEVEFQEMIFKRAERE
jgi:hypothetical protein